MRIGDAKQSYEADEAIWTSQTQKLWLGLFLLILVVFPFAVDSYLLYLGCLVGIAVISTTGLNILTGRMYMGPWALLEPNLGPKLGPKTWVPDLGSKFGAQIWDPDLVPDLGPNLGPNLSAITRITRGSQTRAQIPPKSPSEYIQGPLSTYRVP